MGGKNKNKVQPEVAAPNAETPEAPETPVVEIAESTKKLIARYATEPNAVLRQVDHYYAKVVTGNRDMTWEEFCDLKITAFTEFWTDRKTNPEAHKTLRVLNAEQLVKKEAEFKKMEAKMAAMKAQIEKSKKP